ncbi:unnamed protein product [Caenorhabditis angaria]|uniref:Major facilitator superfamily (MFS) profile domain-containing protein n=1 Tax=Caenorhabditis angaria TaxID=860376 RepID=A0A9P1IK82_9PELO|nr:unnamed protein product [Caenorhabditis angaria]
MVGYHPEPINGQLPLTSTEYSEAGMASGIVTRMIIQPLDVLKIRFQLQEEPIRGFKSGKYKGVVQSVILISKEEGHRAFWKGHIPAQGLSAIYGLVQFSSFEWLSRESGRIFRIDEENQAARSTSDFMCGALSGCLAMTAAMPLDVIRTRLVAQKSGHVVYSGTWHAMQHIWRKEGVAGYFRGWIPSVAQIAPFTGMQFALYNCFMDLWPFLEHDSTGALFSGAMAGTVSKTVLYPLDMVRHRLQMNGFERSGFGKTSNYSQGLLNTVMMVVRNESWLGLFKGLWPSQIKAVISISRDRVNSRSIFSCLGFLVSTHATAFTVSKLVFGVAADRASNLRIFTGGIFICALATIGLAFSTVFSQMLVVMFLIGCMQGAGWVPATKLLAQIFDDSQYPTMFSILGCGSTVAGLLLPYLKTFYWRTILFNMALVFASVAGVARFFVVEEAKAEKVARTHQPARIRDIVASPVTWHIAAIYFFSMEMRTVAETWIPFSLAENSSGFQVAYELGGLVGTLVSGVVVERMWATRRVAGYSATVAMMVYALMIWRWKMAPT